jgi:hypothetical protein
MADDLRLGECLVPVFIEQRAAASSADVRRIGREGCMLWMAPIDALGAWTRSASTPAPCARFTL